MTMPGRRGLVQVVGYLIAGQAIYMICQFGILSSISHFRGALNVGIFGIAVAITTPIFIFANSGLRLSQSADQVGNFRFGEYAAFRLWLTVAAFILCAIISLFVSQDITVKLIIILLAGAKFFESATELSYGLFEQHERTDLVFNSLVIRGILSFAGFFGLIVMGAKLEYAFLAQLLVWAAVAIFLDIPAAVKLTGTKLADVRIDSAQFKALFKYVFPVGSAGFLTGLQPSILRMIVASQMNLVALGIFTNIFYLFQAGAMLSNSIVHALVPRLARIGLSDDRQSQRSQSFTILVPIALACVLGIWVAYVWGEPILRIAFGAETAEYTNVLIIISFALAARIFSAVPNSLHFVRDGAKSILFREMFLAATAIAAGYVLVPLIGVAGAATALLILSVLRLVIATVAASRASNRIATTDTETGG